MFSPDRPAPYIPPAPTEDESEIFKSIEKGINFDRYDSISVEVSGRDPISFISCFDEAGLYPSFLRNVKRAGYEKPTPVQKYAIPIISAGRDLMACAQTGSGKTVSLSCVYVDVCYRIIVVFDSFYYYFKIN